jgi:GT2 family glycosyltransferase
MSKDDKVAILLSTYNGTMYMKEQMESLFKQTYKNVEIIVRDDGSTDNMGNKESTIDVLKTYEDDGKIKLITGENIGFAKSFFELLRVNGDVE